MIEYKQCRLCKGKNLSLISGKPIADPGYIVTRKLGPDGKTYQDFLEECSCHKTWRARRKLESSAKRASLDPRWIDFDPNKDYVGTKSIENIKRIENYVSKSIDKKTPTDIQNQLASCVLYIYGPNGTQKSTMANWMGYEFLRNGKSVRYILMNDLIKMLQKAERDEEIQARLDKLADVDLLLIDEAFDKEKVTIYRSNFQIPFLDTFLRKRIQSNRKGIVFISNVSPFNIEEGGFNHSIQDLVLRNINICEGDLELLDNYESLKSKVDLTKLF